MPDSNHYDYIIAGGGCAGMSLVYYINQTELKNKKILIIDKIKKNQNDRTWCFWDKEVSEFEKIVCKKWEKLNFFSDDYSASLNFSPFKYKMIRGIDFYEFININILYNSNIEFYYGEVREIINHPLKAEVHINDNIFSADYVFNSIFNLDDIKNKKPLSYILQHFKGWEIETVENVFNSNEATFMDFRIEQKDECRFFYVLPISSTKALVEFTIFSPQILENDAYDNEIKDYLNRHFKIKDYKINHEEFGVIPMTDANFTQVRNSRIINIGTAGGKVKASSGYAFMRIQQQTKEIVKNLLSNKLPNSVEEKTRFKLYDSVLLNIMSKNLYPASKIFTSLFKNNTTPKILSFLNEETSLMEDLKIMSTTHYPPFIKSLYDIIKFKLYK